MPVLAQNAVSSQNDCLLSSRCPSGSTRARATLFFPEGWPSGSSPCVGAPASRPVVVKRAGGRSCSLSQDLTPGWAAGQAVSSGPPPVCEVPSLGGDPPFHVVGEDGPVQRGCAACPGCTAGNGSTGRRERAQRHSKVVATGSEREGWRKSDKRRSRPGSPKPGPGGLGCTLPHSPPILQVVLTQHSARPPCLALQAPFPRIPPSKHTCALLVTAGKGVSFLAWGWVSLERSEHDPAALHAALGPSSPSVLPPLHGVVGAWKSKLNG